MREVPSSNGRRSDRIAVLAHHPNRILRANGCLLRKYLSMAGDNLVQVRGGSGMITGVHRELEYLVARLAGLTDRTLGLPPPN
jgi:hypothetical protein